MKKLMDKENSYQHPVAEKKPKKKTLKEELSFVKI